MRTCDRFRAQCSWVAGLIAQGSNRPFQGLLVSTRKQVGYGYSVNEASFKAVEWVQPHRTFEGLDCGFGLGQGCIVASYPGMGRIGIEGQGAVDCCYRDSALAPEVEQR